MQQKNNKKWNVHNSPMGLDKFERLVEQGRWFCKHYRTVEEEYNVYVSMFNVRHNNNYQCQECGVKDPRVQVHHIKSQRDFPELSDKEENMVVLCKKCHGKVHGRR